MSLGRCQDAHSVVLCVMVGVCVSRVGGGVCDGFGGGVLGAVLWVLWGLVLLGLWTGWGREGGEVLGSSLARLLVGFRWCGFGVLLWLR